MNSCCMHGCDDNPQSTTQSLYRSGENLIVNEIHIVIIIGYKARCGFAGEVYT